MTGKRVLITGSTGFVGTAFRRWLALNWPDTIADTVDIVGEPMGQPGPAGTFVCCDIRDWMREWHPADHNPRYDLVIHLAAVVGGRATIDGQPMQVATDLAIDADFWQWVLRAKPRQVVYFSSSAAYPICYQNDPQLAHEGWRLQPSMINLDRIEQPDAIYGLVKLVGEQQARHVARVLEGQTTVNVFRPFSGYGVGQALDYPAPSIVARAVARENPLTLWSDTTRDFVYIDDVVEIVMRTMSDAPTGQVYTDNIASGRPTSFVDFARLAADIVGYVPEIVVLPGKPTGVQYRVGEPGLMRPSITLADGISRMIAALS